MVQSIIYTRYKRLQDVNDIEFILFSGLVKDQHCTFKLSGEWVVSALKEQNATSITQST